MIINLRNIYVLISILVDIIILIYDFFVCH